MIFLEQKVSSDVSHTGLADDRGLCLFIAMDHKLTLGGGMIQSSNSETRLLSLVVFC